jgi:hypothetical protein
MKILSAFTLALLFSIQLSACNPGAAIPPKDPVSHAIWNELLQKHVGADGFVDYQGFIKDKAKFQQYLDLLQSAHPQASWGRDEQMAYWINAYNAFTVKLILDNYPVESIKDIKNGIPFVNTVWDIKFIKIQGEEYDLNNIEHGILRKDFKDARIHAAVNCASYSCPVLRGEAFVASRLDAQLDAAMTAFVNDPRRNKLSADNPKLSSIFKWYSGDFKDEAESIRAYVNKYAKTKINKDADIDYLDYDWRLNDAAKF